MATDEDDGDWEAALRGALFQQPRADEVSWAERGRGRPPGIVGSHVSRNRIQRAREEAQEQEESGDVALLPPMESLGERLARARREHRQERDEAAEARLVQFGNVQLLTQTGCDAQRKLAIALVDCLRQHQQPETRAADTVLTQLLEGKASTASASSLAASS